MTQIKMDNTERVYKLCEYLIDLINEIDRKEHNLDWIITEIESIREDIDNSQRKLS